MWLSTLAFAGVVEFDAHCCRDVRPLFAREGEEEMTTPTEAERAKAYTPLTWDADSKLSADEQAAVEINRRHLFEHGVTREPLLTRMAFEFGAVQCMLRAEPKKRPAKKTRKR